MSWMEEYRSRLKTADEALAVVRSGQRVYIHQGCAEPEALVKALVRRGHELWDVEVIHMATMGSADYTLPEFEGHFRHNTFFIGANVRQAEQEGRADQAGATLLEATGQSGRGLVEFFDNFRYQEVFDQSRRFAYFRSHPLSSERIDALRSRVERLSHYEQVDSPDDLAEHEIMKAKLEGFMNPQSALIKYKESDRSYPARYARAIAYYQMKEPDRAVAQIDSLLTEQPNNPYLWELKGQVLFEFNRVQLAEEPQRKSVALKPDAPLLRINLGQTLIGLNDPKKVEEGVQELKRALIAENDNAVTWRLLAQAYDQQGKDGEARLATAEQYFSLGAPQE
ncbi:MAG: tetratricopeptide repeat protein, partial [Bryobacteraceae bacterium]|nr:tetratricopeptide repeat protein [Bryobacteraceae bacterium]